eukprot:5410957-Amphidinium_carterae.1
MALYSLESWGKTLGMGSFCESWHFASTTLRLPDSSRKTMVLPWFEPVSGANGTEVVKVINRIVSDLPALRPLRLLHGLVIHTIFSDKGTQLINKQVEKFCQDILICHLQFPSYQQSSNGPAEVMVKFCKSATCSLQVTQASRVRP